MIRDSTVYSDLGGDYFNSINEDHIVKYSKSRLESLGFKVTLEKTTTTKTA